MASAPKVLVVGALHYDVVVRAPRLPALDETLDGSSVAYVFGGKGGNQAVAAARHGAATAMAGRVGADAAGRFMIDHLDRHGVDHSMVRVDPNAETGMSVAILTEAGEYGAVIVSGANTSIRADDTALPEGLAVLLLQNEIPAEVNAAVARRARALGATVMHNAAPVRAADAEFRALVDLLIVNRVEAASIAGRAIRSVADAMEMSAGSGNAPGTLIVTLGADGLVCRQPGMAPHHLPAFAVSVCSTHGAGDAFAGALAARLAEGEQLEPALRYAQAAAALHVSSAAASRSTLGRADVRRFLAERRA